MSVITISRGCHSRGREIAQEVAGRLGYACVSREILLDASEIFNASELKLENAIHDAPSLLDRFTNGKERYVAYVRAALLKFLKEDNVVYHGLAGHFFVRDIAHCLKVRVLADMKDRVALEMGRGGVSEKAAVQRLQQDDEERRKWGKWLYGIDTSDPGLYDLVLHLGRLGTGDAAEIVCRAARLHCFGTTAESKKAMEDLAVAAGVQAALVEDYPGIDVIAASGKITITGTYGGGESSGNGARRAAEMEARAMHFPGVAGVEVRLRPLVLFDD